MGKQRRVGLVFGGRTVEHAVSLASARTIDRGLRAAGMDVVPLGIAPDGRWQAPETGRAALDSDATQLASAGTSILASLQCLIDARIDVVFPIVHGTWGEDGALQGLCEMLDVPYVGTGVATSAVAMDKLLCKDVLAAHGLVVVEHEVVTAAAFNADAEAVVARAARLPLPLFVKPCIGGSSVGVSRVDDVAELHRAIEHGLRFGDRLLVERGVIGRELECAVLGYRTIEASAIGEILPAKSFYDYADKYLDGAAGLVAPAEIDDPLDARLRRLAIEAFQAVDGWGMARVDFLVEPSGRAYVNEINTLPGFTDISMYPRLWQLEGVSLASLVARLIDIAFERHADRGRLDRGIKAWIADLARPDRENDRPDS